MKKPLTDETLEQLGILFTRMVTDAHEAWVLGMKVLPLQSTEYRKLCQAGKNAQAVRDHLRDEAVLRDWPAERMARVFGNPTYVSFN